jgi:hypothetical protein
VFLLNWYRLPERLTRCNHSQRPIHLNVNLVRSHSHDGAAEQSFYFQPTHFTWEIDASVQFQPGTPVDFCFFRLRRFGARVSDLVCISIVCDKQGTWVDVRSDAHSEIVFDPRRHASHELEEDDKILVHADSDLLRLLLIRGQDLPFAIFVFVCG